jgi:hypothetical protein
MENKKKIEKQKKKRAEKKKEINKQKESKRITKSKQREMLDGANKAREIRRMELMGLGVIFKVLHGRSVTDKDKFTPRDIALMCREFIKKHKEMKPAEKKEFFPLVALAKRKIDSYERYKQMNKKLEEENKAKDKKKKDNKKENDLQE